jgi:hypothetical protein
VDIIAEAVRKNESITKLSLKKTDLTSAGMQSLVEALSSNTNIMNVNLSDNSSVSSSEKLEKVRFVFFLLLIRFSLLLSRFSLFLFLFLLASFFSYSLSLLGFNGPCEEELPYQNDEA